MMEESEENRLDRTLREKFEDFNLTPDGRVWTGIEGRIAPPGPKLGVRRRPLPLPLLFGLTALLAGLLGWLLPHGQATPKAERVAANKVVTKAPVDKDAASAPNESVLADAETTRSAQAQPRSSNGRPSVTLSASRYQALLRQIVANRQRQRATSSSKLRQTAATNVATQAPYKSSPQGSKEISSHASDVAPTAVVTPAGPVADQPAEPTADPVPASLLTLVALERQSLEQLPSIATLAPGTPPAGSRAALLTNLRAERAELLRLQRRTDSTLLALGDLPGAPLPAVAAAAIPPVDTPQVSPLTRRWSLLLSATPERNTLNFQGPDGDSLTQLRRNNETGRVGFSAALMAEYRLTPRLQVGGGVGYSTFGADLRINNKSTDVSVKYKFDTLRTNNVQTFTTRTYTLRLVYAQRVVPVFGPGGQQIIRYDTIYVPRRDTLYTTVTQRNNTVSTTQRITPLISQKTTINSRLYQPNYRFFTVPVLLRYRLTTGPGRWWADVAGGAQFQFFLGGTQVVTDDGANFRLEKIGPNTGPFRPLNVSLSGAMALNYALTNRLSVSAAPSIRWQALSVYKSETGLRQQPTATGLMLGLRFEL